MEYHALKFLHALTLIVVQFICNSLYNMKHGKRERWSSCEDFQGIRLMII